MKYFILLTILCSTISENRAGLCDELDDPILFFSPSSLDSAKHYKEYQDVLDSLTRGFFSQSFQVDAPYSNAIHSIAFYKDSTFDYRILDERYGNMDFYKGIWIYSNDSIRISVQESYSTDYTTVDVFDSIGKIIGQQILIGKYHSREPIGYYGFSKDVLAYSYNRFRGGTLCFPKRYDDGFLSQNCLLKTSHSFLHE